MKLALLLLSLPTCAFAAKAPALPKDLEAFLGPPPAKFEQKFRKPARELKAALMLMGEKKLDAAIAKLGAIANSELGEHAAFELALALQRKKDFAKSNLQLEKIFRLYPGSIYAERARELHDQNECDQGVASHKSTEAIPLLERCLWRASWKEWGELEPQATSLYDYLKSAKDPLFDSLVAEVIQALPASSALRQRIAKEVPNEKLNALANMPRYRVKNANPAGVKPTNPDADLFDSGMKMVLEEDWKEANSIFKRFLAEYPQSEHWDRAQFWIARTEEKLGHKDEAKKKFETILQDSPFTYYGLQAALYLKHDWSAAIAQPLQEVQAKFTGTPLPRQALSLWKLRALLEAGAIESAREEARFLFALKLGGSTLGQEDPRGALLLARLYGDAGHYMAAFSHAYSAVAFDPTLLDRGSLSLIFPQPFATEFALAAEKSGVHPLLLTSVAKQESAFLPNALSRSDALGLMQLLVPSAKEVLPQANRENLYEPALNTQAGSLYLYKLLMRFDGNIALALAGYNAGPNRASQWQRDISQAPLMKKGFDPDAFIDAIPFSETRKYVANILRNYAWYKLLAQKDGTITSIQELMFQWQKPTKEPVLVDPPPFPPGPEEHGPVNPASP